VALLGGLLGSAATGVVLLILLFFAAPIVVWLLFLFGSIGIFKRGKESVDAETYRSKMPGTVIFVAVLSVVVLLFSVPFIQAVFVVVTAFAELEATTLSSFVYATYGLTAAIPAIPLILSAIGVILVFLDIAKNGKDLAKIK
jgi:hypothetical protein